jgi:hypothetical protein
MCSPENLLFLLDDDLGTLPISASALLVELALLECVGVTAEKPGGKPDRLAVLRAGPTGDPLLDAAFQRLRDREGRSMTDAVSFASKNARTDTLAMTRSTSTCHFRPFPGVVKGRKWQIDGRLGRTAAGTPARAGGRTSGGVARAGGHASGGRAGTRAAMDARGIVILAL